MVARIEKVTLGSDSEAHKRNTNSVFVEENVWMRTIVKDEGINHISHVSATLNVRTSAPTAFFGWFGTC